MRRRLGKVAALSTGFPFRGRVEAQDDGTIPVIQARDIGHLSGSAPNDLMRLHEEARYQRHFLKPDSILMQARGERLASDIFKGAVPTIAGQGLFVLKPDSVLLPEFLLWYLRHPRTRTALLASCRGTRIPFLPKKNLEDLEVPIPPLEQQQKVIELDRIQTEHKRLTKRLLELNDELMNAATYNVVSANT